MQNNKDIKFGNKLYFDHYFLTREVDICNKELLELKNKNLIKKYDDICKLYSNATRKTKNSKIIELVTDQILIYDLCKDYIDYKDYILTKELFIELINICYSFDYKEPYFFILKNYLEEYNMPYRLIEDRITYTNEELKSKIKYVSELEKISNKEKKIPENIRRSKLFINQNLDIGMMVYEFQQASLETINEVIEKFNNHFVKIYTMKGIICYYKANDKWESENIDTLMKAINEKKIICNKTYHLLNVDIIPMAYSSIVDKNYPVLFSNLDKQVILNLYIECRRNSQKTNIDFVQHSKDNFHDIFESYCNGKKYRVPKKKYLSRYIENFEEISIEKFTRLIMKQNIIQSCSKMNINGVSTPCYIASDEFLKIKFD